jgi:hypothetical protein
VRSLPGEKQHPSRLSQGRYCLIEKELVVNISLETIEKQRGWPMPAK